MRGARGEVHPAREQAANRNGGGSYTCVEILHAIDAAGRRLRELMRHRRGGEVARVASMAWRAGSESLGTAALVSAQTWTRSPRDTLDRLERAAPHHKGERPRIEAQLEL